MSGFDINHHHHHHHHHHKTSSIIITINYIIIVVVVVVVAVDDDAYYWVYLSYDHPFQVHYKVRQLVLLQSVWESVITMGDKCYYKVRQVLQSATIITKWNRTDLDVSTRRRKIVSQIH